MKTVDERIVQAPMHMIFRFAREVESWPKRLPHYRYVRFRERAPDGGGVVEMAANRPFGVANWPTWWVSQMSVHHRNAQGGEDLRIRFRHIEGITTGMDVEWSFKNVKGGVRVRIVHAWDGPNWPAIGSVAAKAVIGPVFIHGIASRTLEGLARAAEMQAARESGALMGGKRVTFEAKLSGEHEAQRNDEG
jgi:ribosome-associated toxin RatA of RatAB toxin-antitoxin module